MMSHLNALAADADTADSDKAAATAYFLLVKTLLQNDTFLKNMAASSVGEELYTALAGVCSKNPKAVSPDARKLIIDIVARLTVGFPDKSDLLGKRIVDDLEQMGESPDTEFIN